MMQTPFAFVGSKYKMADWIISHLPEHKTYVEVFGGTGAVLLTKQPSNTEVYNDRNGLLSNFFEILRTRTKEFIENYDLMCYSEILHDKYQSEPYPYDPLEKALRYWYLIITSFNGQSDGGFGYTIKDRNSNVERFANKRNILIYAAARIKNVCIMNRDFEELIDLWDGEDTVFYCDPSYYGKEFYYNHHGEIFKLEDHKRLLNKLNNIKGKTLVSYYQTPEIFEMYKDWYSSCIEMNKCMVFNDQDKPKDSYGMEYLYMNYEKENKQITLF